MCQLNWIFLRGTKVKFFSLTQSLFLLLMVWGPFGHLLAKSPQWNATPKACFLPCHCGEFQADFWKIQSHNLAWIFFFLLDTSITDEKRLNFQLETFTAWIDNVKKRKSIFRNVISNIKASWFQHVWQFDLGSCYYWAL